MLSLRHAMSFFSINFFMDWFSLDDWTITCDACYKRPMLHGASNIWHEPFPWRLLHGAWNIWHEPLPFHMIWHNTWPVFHDTLGMYTCMHMCICVPYDTWHERVAKIQIRLLYLTSLPITSFQQGALIRVLWVYFSQWWCSQKLESAGKVFWLWMDW
jgi:hypothetical protein